MRRLLLLLGTVLALSMPATASAADTLINFSGFPDNTTIYEQYLGSDGVSFSNASTFGFPTVPTLQTCSEPYIASGKLNGAALGIDCRSGSNEFPDRRFNTAIEFRTERRQAGFKIVQHTGNTQNVVVKYYAAGNSVLCTDSFSLAPDTVRPTSCSHATADGGIVGVQVYGDAMGYSDTGGVFIDDLAATVDPVPPPKKFTVAIQTPTVDVVEGSSVDAQVSVRRYNGSSGAVTLSVGALPPVIASASFTPSSVTGVNPATLHISANTPFNSTQQIPVNVSGGGGDTFVSTGSLLQTVNGQPALYFATGGRSPIRLVPGCGAQTIKDSFGIRGDFSGYTSFNFGGSIKASGLDTRTTTGSGPYYPHGDGTYPFEYHLDPGTADGGGSFKIHMEPLYATPVDLNLNWISDRLAIKRVGDRAPALPLKEGGNTLTVIGNFPLNCPVKFKDSLDQEWTVREHDQTEEDGKLWDLYRLNMPSTAVSGPLRALNGAGAEMARTQDLDVREFRRTYGMSISNGTKGGATGTYSWADFERTFGTDDTDACFLVCVHDPVASDYYDQFKKDVESGNGLCFGYAVMAARFRGYGTGQKFTDYQAGAARAWDINVYDDSLAKRDIVRWFVTQNDKSFRTYRSRATSRAPAAEKTLLKDLINQQGAAILGISSGTQGHAITAYGYVEGGDGTLYVSTYDSNIPYQGFEQSDKATRTGALARSQITINPDGSWSGGSLGWSGPNSTLRVYENIPPQDPKLPGDFSLSSLFSSTDGSAPPAAVTGIESGGKAQLDSDGLPVKGSSVDLVPSLSGNGGTPEYDLAKNKQYELTIKGTRKGSYDSSLMSGSNASVRSVDTRPGQIDRVIVRSGEASLRFATGAASSAVTYDLKDKSGKARRTALVALTAREGGEDEAELNGGTLRIAHDGAPTRASITLGSVGEGLPGTVQTAPLALGRGQRLELRPRSWSRLTDGVGYTVRAKNGRVLRRGTARLRASTKVAVGGVKATRRGRKLTVTGRVTKRGGSPLLVATATIVKGGRTLRRKTTSLKGGKVKKGRFSLPLTIGPVPAGAQISVDVLLLDQSAGLATARRTVSVR